jgi:hypothetical protein
MIYIIIINIMNEAEATSLEMGSFRSKTTFLFNMRAHGVPCLLGMGRKCDFLIWGLGRVVVCSQKNILSFSVKYDTLVL